MRPADSLRNRRTALTGWRRFCAVLGVMALVLQVLLPGSAQASDGMWIEICSEAGVETIRVDMSDADTTPTTPTTCRDCCPCVIGSSLPPALAPQPMAAPLTPQAMTWRAPARDAIIAPNAARFWPENRGPPLSHTDQDFTDVTSMDLPQDLLGRAMS